ncbi:conserved hypothetical protein, partial [Ixodes scapularis]
ALCRHSETGTRFPKLGECAHFHYDMMDLASVQESFVHDIGRTKKQSRDNGDLLYTTVTCRERSWTLRRSYDNFRLLDEQLHRCVYDRQHSRLAELPDPGQLPAEPQQRE